jgi:hypothetical protein
MQPTSIRKDTRAWKAQVWISFATAVVLCAVGLAYLPGQDIDRAFMVMGYLFCLTTAFALAKFVRDNEVRRTDTPLWGVVIWGGFWVAMALTAWGLWRMDVNPTYKAFLGVSWLFVISTAFTLAKTLRDAHEALLADARCEGYAMRSTAGSA